MLFSPFRVYLASVFLSGNLSDPDIPTPLPPLVENFTIFHYLKPSLSGKSHYFFKPSLSLNRTTVFFIFFIRVVVVVGL